MPVTTQAANQHLEMQVAKTARDYQEDLIDAVHEMAEWGRVGQKSRRYVFSKQWDDMENASAERNQLKLTHNVIKRDIENLVARLIEADPVMETQGRGAEDWQISDIWKDLLTWTEEWTGQRYDSVLEVRRQCFMDMYTVGLGVEEVGFAREEEAGQGMVYSKRLDPFHIAWSEEAESVQLRDAEWITKYPPTLITQLEKEFPDLKGEIRADVPGFFTEAFEQARFEQYRTLLNARADSQTIPSQRYKKAYRREHWEKEWKWVKRFFLRGKLWMVEDVNPEDPEGDAIQRPGTVADFKRRLTPQEQELYQDEKIEESTLTKTVIINDHIAAKKKTSVYDDSLGGHGEYPFAFYMGSNDPDQTHPHGDVEFLMGYQDFINQMMSRYAESMFIQNSQFLWLNKGMMPKGEEGKIDQIGRKPIQKIYGYPGQAPPQFVGSNAQTAQLWQQGIQFLTDMKDKMSTVSDVNRNSPRYELSGKAVRALQADADLFSTIPRKNVESGMSQATQLRIQVIMQFFRGKRFARISPKASSTSEVPYTIFMGNDDQSTKDTFALREAQGEPAGPGDMSMPGAPKPMQTPKGEKGVILSLNDDEIRKFDLRLSLDSGKEAKKAERAELVTNMMQYMGPAAGMGILKWAAQLLEVPNYEQLVQAIDESDDQAKIVAQIQAAEKQLGMPFAEMVQALQSMAAPAPPGGPPGPGGPPAPAMAPPGPGGSAMPPPPVRGV